MTDYRVEIEATDKYAHMFRGPYETIAHSPRQAVSQVFCGRNLRKLLPSKIDSALEGGTEAEGMTYVFGRDEIKVTVTRLPGRSATVAQAQAVDEPEAPEQLSLFGDVSKKHWQYV